MDAAVRLLWNCVNDDRAATAVEYGLIAVGISIAGGLVVLSIGQQLSGTFAQIAGLL